MRPLLKTTMELKFSLSSWKAGVDLPCMMIIFVFLSPVVLFVPSMVYYLKLPVVSIDNENIISYSFTFQTKDLTLGIHEIGLQSGNYLCVANYPVLLFDKNLTGYNDERILPCYSRADGIVFTEEMARPSGRETETSYCFLKGNGLVFSRKANKEINSLVNGTICYFKGNEISFTPYANTSNVDIFTNTTPCQLKERGKFYADSVISRSVDNMDLATCYDTKLGDVPILRGLTTSLLVFAYLRIFLMPTSVLCAGCSKVGFFTVFVPYYLLELSNLVYFVIYPSIVLKYDGLTRTSTYFITLAFVALLDFITLYIAIVKPYRKSRFSYKPAPKQWNDVRTLVEELWRRELVGRGRDAIGLDHNNIKIEEVFKIPTPIPESYQTCRSDLINYASCIPTGKIPVLGITHRLAETTDVLTNKCQTLKPTVDESINEVYLFHGTSSTNVESIVTHGFDVRKCRSTFLGHGIYFADNPVKADQFTGRMTGECTMLLSRVLLGKTIVLKNSSNMLEAQGPPCSNCLVVECNKNHRIRLRPFDSVSLHPETGLFREFVVFDNQHAHPEFIIKYKRV